jgi:hypothetical protein
MSNELPSDYEQCGDCGLDHSYEYEEAVKAHALILPTTMKCYCNKCGEDYKLAAGESIMCCGTLVSRKR